MRGMPARERNTVLKNPRGKLRVALVYPQRYRAGIANLGMQIVYAMLNERREVYAERFYLDVHEGLRSVETRSPLRDFDVVAFCWQYEPDALSMLQILERGGILTPEMRGERVVIAGGACAVNPLPLAEYLDAFYVGEAERGLVQVLDALQAGSREQVLEELAALEFVYIPGVKEHARRAFCDTLPAQPAVQVVSDAGAFGESHLLEVARGCGRSCRFCMGGYIFRPRRERRIEEIEALLQEWAQGGVRKVALLGASVTDHSSLDRLTELLAETGMQVSAPSLRADALSEDFVRMLVESGQRTVTLAPEACEELRLRLNKHLTDEELVRAAELCARCGVRRLRLYMMYGLPGEREEHIEKAAALVRRIKRAFGGRVKLSLSPFVPKPHTPLQWCAFCEQKLLRRRLKLFRKLLAGVAEVESESIRASLLQAAIAKGGREVGRALLQVQRGGGMAALRSALSRHTGERSPEEPLPWEGVDVGVSAEHLREEYLRYLAAEPSPECFPGCRRCGACR